MFQLEDEIPLNVSEIKENSLLLLFRPEALPACMYNKGKSTSETSTMDGSSQRGISRGKGWHKVSACNRL